VDNLFAGLLTSEARGTETAAWGAAEGPTLALGSPAMAESEDDLFEGLADFEVRFFRDLIRSYAKLDLGMRGFFYHRIKQVVKEAIDLLRAERADTVSTDGEGGAQN
jgi:hypothetical protein